MQELAVVTDSARGYSVSTTIIPAVANEHTNSSYSTAFRSSAHGDGGTADEANRATHSGALSLQYARVRSARAVLNRLRIQRRGAQILPLRASVALACDLLVVRTRTALRQCLCLGLLQPVSQERILRPEPS